MTNCNGAIRGLLGHLDAVSRSGRGRQSFMRWQLLRPELSGVGDLGQLAGAIRNSDPVGQDELLSAVLHLAGGDQLAQLVSVAGLTGHLQRIVTRWAKAGVSGSVLAGLELDLVSECWAAVQRTAVQLAQGGALPQRPALAVVTTAWVAARGPRLRELRSPVRQVPLGEAAGVAWGRGEHPGVELHRHLVDAVSEGALDRRSAALVFSTRLAGTSVNEAAAHYGVSAGSFRQLRSRAERRLARSVLQSARTTAAV